MGLITLQDIFQRGYPDYEQTHPLPAHVRKAARAILQCRTAALGGHVQACPDGHVRRIWYNSCRHRSCPQCSFMEIERWLATQRARLLACDHYHVIFTIPHDLNALWLANVPLLSSLLFQAVRDTLTTLLADPKYLGAQPGILAALHTWGQTLVLHPHLHCLVTGGGLTPDGQWVAVRHGFLLPVRVAMAVFRGKFLAALRTAWQRDALQLPAALRPQAFLNLLTRLGHPKKTRWNVHIQERYPHGTGVATYLARYMRGGPLKNSRLVACDGETVTFRSIDNHARSVEAVRRPQLMTLPLGAFLQRVLQHVPPPGTQVVRSWGLYQPRQADALAVCRAQLGQPPVVVPVRLDWQTVCAQRGAAHPERCPTCGQLLVCTGMIPRGGVAPPAWPEECAA
jgi:Putative transposase/Transposase zinc-binding domain